MTETSWQNRRVKRTALSCVFILCKLSKAKQIIIKSLFTLKKHLVPNIFLEDVFILIYFSILVRISSYDIIEYSQIGMFWMKMQTIGKQMSSP